MGDLADGTASGSQQPKLGVNDLSVADLRRIVYNGLWASRMSN